MQSKKELALELQNVIGQLRRSGLSNHHHDHHHKSLRDSDRMMLFMISQLNNGQPVTTSEVANKLGITLPAVTHKINTLELEGLIKRVTDETDRRVVYISLSAKGKGQVKKLEKVFASKLGLLTDFLGESDTKDLIRIVKKIADFPKFLGDNKNNA
ncbi:MAG: MarR family transcriptional regulator [Candidatus Berkelbacteria bacterium]